MTGYNICIYLTVREKFRSAKSENKVLESGRRRKRSDRALNFEALNHRYELAINREQRHAVEAVLQIKQLIHGLLGCAS